MKKKIVGYVLGEKITLACESFGKIIQKDFC